MDSSNLTAIGLTPPQAKAYALLVEHGSIKPPEAATVLGLTRSNAYKLLDKLVELQLAEKLEEGKKISYSLANPVNLSNITARFRAQATAREEAASRIMQDLLAKYYEHSERPDVQVVTGRQAVADAYRWQANLKEEIFFIHTRSDINAMGFETMHDIRTIPARHGQQRHAIMTEALEPGPINYANHRRSNLQITWAKHDDYTAPVEWSVTKSSLLIALYASEPQAVIITDPIVAGAFLQLWQLMSRMLEPLATHQRLKP